MIQYQEIISTDEVEYAQIMCDRLLEEGIPSLIQHPEASEPQYLVLVPQTMCQRSCLVLGIRTPQI
jgi:hypothetical protein